MHKIRSEKQFPYKCGMKPCQSSFNSMEKLKLHLRTHNNDYDECQFCSYRYFDPYNYKTHLRCLVSMPEHFIIGLLYHMSHIIDGKLKWGASFQWSTSIFCSMRNWNEMTSGKTLPTLYSANTLSYKCIKGCGRFLTSPLRPDVIIIYLPS